LVTRERASVRGRPRVGVFTGFDGITAGAVEVALSVFGTEMAVFALSGAGVAGVRLLIINMAADMKIIAKNDIMIKYFLSITP
jgi:hypothetical protein